jgi:hypothetical protein
MLTPVESNLKLHSGVLCGVELWVISDGGDVRFLKDELSGLLEDVSLTDEVVSTANMTELIICHVAVPTVGRPGLQPWPTALWCMGTVRRMRC